MNDIPETALDPLLVVTGLDLLAQRPGSEQRLDEPFRARLVEVLERSLLNRQRLRLYMRALDEVLGTRKPAAAEVGEEAFDAVLEKGLAVLPDRDLLLLGLDGPELLALHVGLKEGAGPHW